MSSKGQNRTIGSYIVGYVLSLIFTLAAYYAVVHHLFTYNPLLTFIFICAFIQMIVQVLIFLHIGQGAKPLYDIVFFVATVGMMFVVVGGAIFIMNQLHYNMAPNLDSKQLAEGEAITQVEGNKTGACGKTKVNHIISFRGSTLNPSKIQAHVCDSLTFRNDNGSTRQIIFGVYPQQWTYGGQESVAVPKNRNTTITLNVTGTYPYYDRSNPKLTGTLEVTK